MDQTPLSPSAEAPTENRQQALADVLGNFAQAIEEQSSAYCQDLQQLQAVVSDAFVTLHRLLDQHGLAGTEAAVRALQFEDIASQLIARAQASVVSLRAYADELNRQCIRLAEAGTGFQAAETCLAEAAAALAEVRKILRPPDKSTVRQYSVREGEVTLF